MAAEPHWDTFEHEAGIGVVGVGGDVADAFSEAARALTALVTDLGKVEGRTPHEIRLAIRPGTDTKSVLVDWLNAVIQEMDQRQLLFSEFDIFLGPTELVARTYGEPLNPRRHHLERTLLRAIPAAVDVRQEDSDTWVAECVVEAAPAAGRAL